MKKRILSAILACSLTLALLPGAALAAESEGLSNFRKSNTYTQGQFTDVASTAWYASNVQAAYELGLMKGQSGTAFGPDGTLTLAEAVAMAARLHSIYHTGEDNFQQGSPWYQVYVDYAAANGIYSSANANYTSPINRGDFAYIIANALPAGELAPINTVEDRAIPDVPTSSYISKPVYTLYRAGVLTGSGADGAFEPGSTITRAAVAAIVTRMADPSQRQKLTLTVQPVTLYAWGDRTIQVWPDEVALYEAQGWSKTPVYTQVRNTPIRIRRQPVVGKRDSVGGISFDIQWNNHSDKAIKYIHFYVTPYNSVWDPVKCEIRGYSTADCYAIGPAYKNSLSTDWSNDSSGSYGILVYCSPDASYVPSDGRHFFTVYDDGTYSPEVHADRIPITEGRLDDVMFSTYWDCMWYNNEIKHLLISKVYIEYMDGTKTTLTGSALEECIY